MLAELAVGPGLAFVAALEGVAVLLAENILVLLLGDKVRFFKRELPPLRQSHSKPVILVGRIAPAFRFIFWFLTELLNLGLPHRVRLLVLRLLALALDERQGL